MSEISRVKEKIRLPSKIIGTIDDIDDNNTLDGFLVEFKEKVEKILALYAELEPTEVKIRTDVDEYWMRYVVSASLLESDSEFTSRMAKLIMLEVEEARVVEEAKIIKSLAYDSELGEYIRLREKFKLYEADK